MQPVPLPTAEDKDSPSESPGADVRVIGWGDTEFEGQFSDGLLYVDLHVVSDECRSIFGQTHLFYKFRFHIFHKRLPGSLRLLGTESQDDRLHDLRGRLSR